MTDVAILGAGAGGLAAVAELTQAGHQARLWNRRAATLAPYREGVVAHTGVLGDGQAVAALVSTDLRAVLDGADVAVICLPALAHADLFADLARLSCTIPVVLNPGHTGGALHLRQVFTARGVRLPPVAELSTLTYVARKQDSGTVRVTGRARQVRCGCLPGGEQAARIAAELFSCAVPAPDVLASSLANVNLVLHPPGAILAAAWVEASGGQFTFYVEAMTAGVARVADSLDAERRAVAAGFGHELPSLAAEMALVGTADPQAAADGDTGAAVRSGTANQTILAPQSLRHRYYTEDFPYAVVPFLALARIAGVQAPVAQALLTVAGTLLGTDPAASGLSAQRLGIGGLGRDELLGLVRS